MNSQVKILIFQAYAPTFVPIQILTTISVLYLYFGLF